MSLRLHAVSGTTEIDLIPKPADANKIPIMIKGLSGKRFAFVMPMLQFKEKVFPRNVIELYNE